MKKQVLIANLIDWSKSFVDNNGSFYCGTTHEQKENVGRVVELADLVIFSSDTHPFRSREFAINGGLYPAHNVVGHFELRPDFEYFVSSKGEPQRLEGRTTSPELTCGIQKYLDDLIVGMLVPKEVYFQDGSSEPWFSPSDVERSFDTEIISEKDFIDSDFEYIVAPKHTFDATRLESDIVLPKEVASRVPKTNFNVFSLLKMKYPDRDYDLLFVNTGVIEGICRLHTSVGLKQMFKMSRVINLTDATTPLAGIGLGFETPEQSIDAAMRVCKDVGVEYMTTNEFLNKFKGKDLTGGKSRWK